MIEKEFRRSEEEIMRKRYYDSRICPNCLLPRDFLETDRGLFRTNIKCKVCGAEFSIRPQTRYIGR